MDVHFLVRYISWYFLVGYFFLDRFPLYGRDFTAL